MGGPSNTPHGVFNSGNYILSIILTVDIGRAMSIFASGLLLRGFTRAISTKNAVTVFRSQGPPQSHQQKTTWTHAASRYLASMRFRGKQVALSLIKPLTNKHDAKIDMTSPRSIEPQKVIKCCYSLFGSGGGAPFRRIRWPASSPWCPWSCPSPQGPGWPSFGTTQTHPPPTPTI